jgi:hypothetical protein
MRHPPWGGFDPEDERAGALTPQQTQEGQSEKPPAACLPRCGWAQLGDVAVNYTQIAALWPGIRLRSFPDKGTIACTLVRGFLRQPRPPCRRVQTPEHSQTRRHRMRFPVNVTSQKQCPVCKKAVPGPASTARPPLPESATLTFCVLSFVQGRSRPVFLGGEFMLSWDSGLLKSPLSRYRLGATLRTARKEARDSNASCIEIQFCSTACLRQFLMTAVDELERRVADVQPEVQATPAKAERGK